VLMVVVKGVTLSSCAWQGDVHCFVFCKLVSRFYAFGLVVA